jgi:hypothetical protein
MVSGEAAPNVVGLVLDDARQVVVAAGWHVEEIVETRPPRQVLQGPRRVVRQRVIGDRRLAFVVCGEQAPGARV